jgi:hypothetical protein
MQATDRPKYEGTGEVAMNPLGPHFYVDVQEGEAPPSMPDLITDMMNHKLGELDSEHLWPIKHEYIEGHTPIASVSWTHDEDKSHNVGVKLEDFSVSMDWYSRQQLREYDFSNY